MGNMKPTLCFDWLQDCLPWSHIRKNCSMWTKNDHNFWRILVMDWQKMAVDGQNKENILNDFHEWIALQKLIIRKNLKKKVSHWKQEKVVSILSMNKFFFVYVYKSSFSLICSFSIWCWEYLFSIITYTVQLKTWLPYGNHELILWLCRDP